MVFLPASVGTIPSRRTLAGLRGHSTARARWFPSRWPHHPPWIAGRPPWSSRRG